MAFGELTKGMLAVLSLRLVDANKKKARESKIRYPKMIVRAPKVQCQDEIWWWRSKFRMPEAPISHAPLLSSPSTIYKTLVIFMTARSFRTHRAS